MTHVLYYRVLAGDAGAEEELEALATEAQLKDDVAAWTAGLISLAEIDLSAGRAEQARDRLVTALRHPALEDRDRHLAKLARAYAALGETARASETAEDSVNALRQKRDPEHLGRALSARGTVRAAERRWVEAQADFEEALTMMREGRRVWDEANALADYGLMLKAKGQVNDAEDKLREALELFDRMGAKPSSDRTRQVLEDLGTPKP